MKIFEKDAVACFIVVAIILLVWGIVRVVQWVF